MQAGGRVGVWTRASCHLLQEVAGAAVRSTSEEKRAIQPTPSQEGPGTVATSWPKQEMECALGEVGPTPCSTQGEPAQKEPSTEACHGGDLGTGLKLRVEVKVGDMETCC